MGTTSGADLRPGIGAAAWSDDGAPMLDSYAFITPPKAPKPGSRVVTLRLTTDGTAVPEREPAPLRARGGVAEGLTRAGVR